MNDTTLTVLRENAQQIIRKLEAVRTPNVLIQHTQIAGEAFDLLRVFLVMVDEHIAPLAIDRVMFERARQITVERFGAARDDSLDSGVLASAGASYALAACDKLHPLSQGGGDYESSPPLSWPFDPSWWKSTTPRRDLEKGCALILAELEKLLRAKVDPVPMVLHCPECGEQHIDRPNHWSDKFDSPSGYEHPDDRADTVRQAASYMAEWTNPPHRTHLCAKCGNEWRPFEYATTGVTDAEAPSARSDDGYTDEEVAVLNACRERDLARRVVEEVHSWAVCGGIATADDMMQNLPRIVEITTPGYKVPE